MIDGISQPIFESASIENFLPDFFIHNLLKTYKIAQKYIVKKIDKNAKLTEVFLPLSKSTDLRYIDIAYVIDSPEIFETTIHTPKNVKKYVSRLRRHIERAFETKKQKIGISRLCIHNLNSALAIHCDGVDLTNRYDDRPQKMGSFTNRHRPILDYDMYNQGLITLQNDNNYNGTVIFDQWYPLSTYIMQSVPYHKNIKKTLIKFFKNEEWTRFGESVRKATNRPFCDSDWKTLCDAVEDKTLLDRDDFFGLSLDKILYFGAPGTCSVWANKKYHASLPTNNWGKRSVRLNLQFETYYK